MKAIELDPEVDVTTIDIQYLKSERGRQIILAG